MVSVALACSVATMGSQVTLVSGASFNCAALTNVSAVPAEAFVGGSIALTASASGPVPSSLTYAWSAPSGSFDQPNAASTHFQCTVPGPVSVTVTAADGPVPPGSACNVPLSTKTVSLQCDAAVQDAGSDAGGGSDAGTPPVVPALPEWAGLLLGLGMLGLGARSSRRPRPGR
jgi:hypothetical protein